MLGLSSVRAALCRSYARGLALGGRTSENFGSSGLGGSFGRAVMISGQRARGQGGDLSTRGLHVSAANAQWRFTSNVVVTPPRERVSWGETLIHILVMYVIWLTPLLYGLTQIKVWRREYGGGGDK